MDLRLSTVFNWISFISSLFITFSQKTLFFKAFFICYFTHSHIWGLDFPVLNYLPFSSPVVYCLSYWKFSILCILVAEWHTHWDGGSIASCRPTTLCTSRLGVKLCCWRQDKTHSFLLSITTSASSTPRSGYNATKMRCTSSGSSAVFWTCPIFVNVTDSEWPRICPSSLKNKMLYLNIDYVMCCENRAICHQ